MFNALLSQKSIAYLNAFTFSAFQVLLLALYPYLADHLGLSIATIITSFSLGSALFLVGTPYWASKSDEWGRKKVLVIGLVGLLVSFALLVAGNILSLAGLIASRVVYGLTACSIIPVAQALQVDLAKAQSNDSKKIAKAMTLHSLSMNLGRAVSLTMIVFVGQKIETIFYAGVVWLTILIVLNLLTQESPLVNRGTANRSNFWLSEFKAVKIIFFVALTFTGFLEMINSSLAIHLKSTFAMDSLSAAQQTAKLLLFCSFGIVAIQALNASLIRYPWRHRMAVGVVALVSGGVILFSASQLSQLWFSIALLSVGIGLIPPIYLALLNDASRSEGQVSHAGKRAGLIGSAHTIGYAIGGLIAAGLRKGIFS